MTEGTTAAGIVLAAGLGTRFGGGKVLAEIRGRPMIQRVLDLAAEAGLTPIVVVLGTDADQVQRQVRWRTEMIVHNPAPAAGLAGSVRLAIYALNDSPDVERALLLLADQPLLTGAQLAAVLAAPRDPRHPIVVPRYADGQPGNPVLLERAAFRLVARLTGDRGMSQLVGSRPELARYVEVPGTNPDIDTQDDLAALNRA